MQITNNKIMKIILPIFLIVILISLVNAFGVSSPYWEGNPLTMAAGETKTVNLNLQNMVGEEDVNVKVEIKEGLEIASLKEDIYTVKSKTSDTFVPLKIKIPREAENTSYKLVAEVRTVTPGGEGGAVMLGTGMTVAFDVLVSGKVESNKFIIIIGACIILAIIIFIIIILRKKFRKKKKSK